MPWFCPIFLIKIVSAVFRDISKKRSKKKNTFSTHDYNTCQYLYGKLKKKFINALGTIGYDSRLIKLVYVLVFFCGSENKRLNSTN